LPFGGDLLERAPEPCFPENAVWIGSPPLRLDELGGKVVLLDFWTSGCINCIHILPNLHRLHDAFPGRLQIIGVHSPKFPAEKDPRRLALAAARLDIEHPVVSDPDFAIWQSFAVDAWPTLVFIDPAGRVVARHAGEFDYDLVHAFIAQLLDHPSVALSSPPTGISPSVVPSTVILHFVKDLARRPGSEAMLRFPGKLAIDPSGNRLYIADSGNHRIVVTTLTGEIETIIGSGLPGAEDGPCEAATFRNPQGMALAPDGASLVVPDAGNHLLRRVDLAARTVETVAGTGTRGFPAAGGPARESAIASPWDLIWFEGRYLIAMAGMHQIWGYDPTTARLEPVAGTGVESIHDDRLLDATFAQPMGLTALGRTVSVADSESSAVRALDFDTGRVRRILGRGLFHFGDLDAIGDSVRLQHPQGIVATVENGRPALYLADSFNNKIKRVDPLRREAVTVAGTGEQGERDGEALDAEFREPSGLALHGRLLFIADTHNHRIRTLDLDRGVVESISLSFRA
jgi:thiol-disulfide isomerase/thioredoxin